MLPSVLPLRTQNTTVFSVPHRGEKVKGNAACDAANRLDNSIRFTTR